MKLSFYFYSKLPLGLRLRQILAVCQTSATLKPRDVLLTSRQRRSDLPTEVVLQSASESASDSCEIKTAGGEIGASWVYGARRHVPRIWGTVELGPSELTAFVEDLDALAAAAGTTYGVCDLKKIRDEAMRRAPDWFVSESKVVALRTLYWYNYFGEEFTPGFAGGRPSSANTITRLTGGLRILTRESPVEPVDTDLCGNLAKEWPVFQDFNAAATFPEPVEIDYSLVWELPSPDVGPRPLQAIIGPSDRFIAQAETLSTTFHQWATRRGLHVETEASLLRVFRKHERIIRDEVMVPAVAAYGEIVRKQMNGIWQKARFRHRGEPVVTIPGRPWKRRRVILEALQALSSYEP